MADIKDLQKLIEERAKKRLENDIQKMGKCVAQNPLFSSMDFSEIPRVSVITDERGGTTNYSLSEIFYNTGNPQQYRKPMKKLYDYWLPKYIEQESKAFLEKLDNLSSQMDDLITFKNQQEGEGY